MNLPSHIRDLLQTNYFVPADELDKPLDEMSPYVRDLITLKCMNGKDFISESETAEVANDQIMEDISSDVSADRAAQADRFVQNRAALEALMLQSAKKSTDHSSFDRVADILAAKRMASDEYANAPKTAETFKHAKESVKKELNIKYWTARYYDAHPAANGAGQAKTVEDIAEIAKMIYADETDKIAGRFNLPDTKQARESAKAATLSFAMADALSFSDSIRAKIKDSAFVRRVEGLNDKFRQKYPKSYIASKIAANGAGALVLGPVFSAFKAASTVSAMRKDYAKYKKEHNEKGSVWKFLRTPEGRQKLMTFGQNTLRVIPGVRAAGIALGAVKNSDSLLSSIKEIKQNGGSKQAWLKVGACTVGLLAVATTAAYANDEVADAVNSFVRDHLGNAVEKIHDVAGSLTGGSHTETQVPGSVREMRIHSDGSVEMNGVLSRMPDSTKGGFKLEALTDKQESAAPTENDEDYLVVKSAHASTSSGGSATVGHKDDEYFLNVNRDGALLQKSDKLGYHTLDIGKDGNISMRGNINRVADPDKGGFTLTHTSYNTGLKSAAVGITDNKSGTNLFVSKGQYESSVSLSKDVDNSIRLSSSTGLDVKAGHVKIDENTTIRSANISSSVRGGSATVGHKDDEYFVNVNRDGAMLQRSDKLGHHTLDIGKDGKISMHGNVNRVADPDKGGFTLTHASYNTGTKSAAVGITDNKSGANLFVSKGQYESNISLSKDINNSIRLSSSTGLDVNAGNVKIDENTTIRRANISTNVRGGSATVGHKDDEYFLNVNRDGAMLQRSDKLGHHTLDIGKDGKISLHGNVNRVADPDKGGFTLTHASYNTGTKSAAVGITDNKSGANLFVSKGQYESNISLSKDINNSIRLSSSTGLDVNAGNVKIDENTTIRRANISTNVRGGSATIGHKDDEYFLNVNRGGVTLQRSNLNSHQHISIGKDGKISGHLNINKEVDTDKKGFRLTNINADTDGHGSVSLKNAKTDTTIRVAADKNEASLSVGRGSGGTTVSVDRKGDVSVSKTGGKKINISGLIRDIRKLVR